MHGACNKIMEVCAETSTQKIQTPGYHPKERIHHSQHGEKFQIKTYTDCNTVQNGLRFAAAPRSARHSLHTEEMATTRK
jgi:alpha-L-arabinofuranosidase